MNGKKLYYILRSVWVVVILLIMLIVMNRDFTDISAKKTQDEEETRLNIALVNEDAGVVKDNTEYNLGSDYVKKIEKDATYNWFTVSRGIAENGLKNGTYNLLVTIPSNFSTKLLDINDQDPEKLQISYKINANGNSTLENESRSVGRKIVNDLNQQLVDLYVASIIDNLYTAQKNIEKVYTNQTESVGDFTNILYTPTVAFQDNFPSMARYSENALQSNDLLKSALAMTTTSADSLVNNNKDYSTTMEELLAQRADGKITYEDFVQTLLSLDTTLSSGETDALFQKVSAMNTYFQTQFSSTEDGEFFVQTTALNEQLAISKQEIEKQQEKLNEIKESFYQTYIKEFMNSFNKEEGTEVITLKDVLDLKDSVNGSTEVKSSEQFQKISQFNQQYNSNMQARLNALPYIPSDTTTTDMPSAFNYSFAPYWSGTDKDTVKTVATNIKSKVEAINDQNRAANGGADVLSLPDQTTQEASSYNAALSTAYQALENARAGINYKRSFDINWNTTGQGQTLKITVPASVDLNSVTLNSTTSNTQKTINTVKREVTFPVTGINETVSYAINSDYDEKSGSGTIKVELKQPRNYTDANGNIQSQTVNYTVKWDEPVDVSMFLSENYQTAKKNYSEQLGRIYELYNTVYAEVETFEEYPFAIFNTFLDTPLTDVFQFVLNDVFEKGDYAKQNKQLTDLMNTANQIEAQKDVIQQTLAQVYENSNTLNDGVNGQLALLSQLISNSSEATQKNSLVTTDNNVTDTQLNSMNSTLKSILQQSEMLKQSSESNVSESESVKNTFDAFDKEVKSAQEKGAQLSTNADTIKKNLDDELKTNDDFVSAFVKVLNNAYNDGVPNNSLLQFIANPIDGKAEATINTAELDQPFTWILIMFTLSLFMAYLFATQPVVKKVKDQFKREKLWMKDNSLETALLSLSAVGVGLVLGILSISELSIRKESQIIWVCIIILFMLIFSLINHYGLKQFHIVGFAFSLFLFISYVFVTNAVGKTKGNNPIADFIRVINPLSMGESNLVNILSNESLNVVHIILYLFAIVALVVINLFIWKPRRKGKDVVKI